MDTLSTSRCAVISRPQDLPLSNFAWLFLPSQQQPTLEPEHVSWTSLNESLLRVNALAEMDLRAAARSFVENIQSGTDEILLLPDNLIHQSTTQEDVLNLLDLSKCENRLQNDVLV